MQFNNILLALAFGVTSILAVAVPVEAQQLEARQATNCPACYSQCSQIERENGFGSNWLASCNAACRC
ncbi:unnamed protein product [Zymoseptoria tritici ST99CH_1A5]|uniref:Invertebrate defensins family profile domain-containing protein n=3 Tax=Zymoseptoria tritici TaxID=1047171 RepID=A0A1X7S5E8_ZYMT9|nr:unnamed protein product [Zymoseptoria tritici ST99CH_3D7]SMR59170.1 unnamed protein product [Zymoseptoria tritici ST99CH_1E4]SMR63006.1 unnamed protein product [Zymoseptoria tritici ST99CH_3D1]SMY28379.1 unnamed protein product [Zymoseptoria tritici ST99CH_1A5]